MSAAQVAEWEAFEKRYGPVLIHERIDIGLAMVTQMVSQSGRPLRDFLPTWWEWMDEADDEQFRQTMNAMAEQWKIRREIEEVKDASKRVGSADHGGRDATEARVHSGDGGDRGVRGGDPDLKRSDDGS